MGVATALVRGLTHLWLWFAASWTSFILGLEV